MEAVESLSVEANLPAKVEQVSVPAIPPLSVWDDHLEALEIQGKDFRCVSEVDFERAKELGGKASKLKGQIEAGYKEVKQAIDAIKAPVLEREKKDVGRVVNFLNRIDGEAGAWSREQKRLAEEKAERERQERIKAEEEKRKAEADLMREWGNEEEAEKIEAAPVAVPRPATPAPTFTYRRGAKVNPKPKARIVDPSKVARAYCVPQMPLINSKVSSHFATIKNPTAEQLKALADEIGGIVIEME